MINTEFSGFAQHDILYREGETLRRLKGRVLDVEQLGFIRVDGFTKTFFLNPRIVERIEQREGGADE